MLLIPFDRPIDWRRPPVVTLALLAANLLAYLLFQLDDGRELYEVKGFYYESGLAEIELPHYRDHLAREGEDRFLAHYGDRVDDPTAPWFARMRADDEFLQRLHAGEVITPADPDHQRWQRLHARLDQRLERTTVWGHGLRPAAATPGDFLTHMFLHGGLFHLLGNMLFLVALGLLVEVALGSLVLTGLYLLGGVGAAALFIAFHPDSVVPMVGASGAVAGLMGLCGVLYGRRPIRFFYFVGVYFDYVKAPALVLLALWLGKEVFQFLQFSELSNVAYTAHIGGLVTGAVAGAAVRFGTGAVDEAALDEPREAEEFDRRLAEANERLAALEPERARPLFERLARDHPGHTEVLDGLFRACRFSPGSEAYHDVVLRILALTAADEATAELQLRAFRDYRARARPRARIGAATMQDVIELLLRRGTADEVEPLVRAALGHPQRFPGIAERALRLATRLLRAGERGRARTLYSELAQRFPGTRAAREASRALTEISR